MVRLEGAADGGSAATLETSLRRWAAAAKRKSNKARGRQPKAPTSASHRKAGAQPRVPRHPAGGRGPPEGARREALEVVLQKDLRATAATSLEAFEGGTRRRLAPRALSRPAASSAVGRDPLKLRGSLPDNLPPGRRGRPDLTAPARPPRPQPSGARPRPP